MFTPTPAMTSAKYGRCRWRYGRFRWKRASWRSKYGSYSWKYAPVLPANRRCLRRRRPYFLRKLPYFEAQPATPSASVPCSSREASRASGVSCRTSRCRRGADTGGVFGSQLLPSLDFRRRRLVELERPARDGASRLVRGHHHAGRRGGRVEELESGRHGAVGEQALAVAHDEPPGACMTPSSVTNAFTTSGLMVTS